MTTEQAAEYLGYGSVEHLEKNDISDRSEWWELIKKLTSKDETELNLHSVSHSYYQVVYNSYDDNIEEVTSPLPTLERAKKALEANKAYFDEDMYIIAKINCG